MHSSRLEGQFQAAYCQKLFSDAAVSKHQMNVNTIATLVTALAHSGLCSDYTEAYSALTGLPIVLRPVQTWQVPLHGRPHENPFCALMASKSGTCAACLQMQEKLAHGAMEQPWTVTCSCGLSETAVPVRLGSQTVGFLQTGQVFGHQPTDAQFAAVAQRVARLGLSIPLTELRNSYFKTPILPPEKLKFVIRLLRIFAEHISIKSNQIAVQAANAQPPMVLHSKQFILEHLTEPLPLAKVAQAAHTSTFYYCKLFKKSTGITFTEFVSRARTERAKNLLLNPHLRVSEIAYSAGFKSLTHFNRTFKAVAGESPTAYRRHLPGHHLCMTGPHHALDTRQN